MLMGVVARTHAFIKIHGTALKICILYYVLCMYVLLCICVMYVNYALPKSIQNMQCKIPYGTSPHIIKCRKKAKEICLNTLMVLWGW